MPNCPRDQLNLTDIMQERGLGNMENRLQTPRGLEAEEERRHGARPNGQTCLPGAGESPAEGDSPGPPRTRWARDATGRRRGLPADQGQVTSFHTFPVSPTSGMYHVRHRRFEILQSDCQAHCMGPSTLANAVLMGFA